MKNNTEQLREVLSLQWNGNEGMIKHGLTNINYISWGDEFNGQYFIDVGAKKPNIQKQFWFDDEQIIPKPNKEYFIEYNMKYNAPQLLQLENNRNERLHLVSSYNYNKTDKLKSVTYISWDEIIQLPVTEELLIVINEAIAEVRTDFAKRLERYWNRYSDKVRFSGYWVNR